VVLSFQTWVNDTPVQACNFFQVRAKDAGVGASIRETAQAVRLHGRRRGGRRGIRLRGQIRQGEQDAPLCLGPGPRLLHVGLRRAPGRACALSWGGDRAVGHVVHSQTLHRHCATSARSLRNEPSETRARPFEARASQIAPHRRHVTTHHARLGQNRLFKRQNLRPIG